VIFIPKWNTRKAEKKKRRSKQSTKQPVMSINPQAVEFADETDESVKPQMIEMDTEDGQRSTQEDGHEELNSETSDNEGVENTVDGRSCGMMNESDLSMNRRGDYAPASELTDGIAQERTPSKRASKSASRNGSKRRSRKSRKSLKICTPNMDDVDLQLGDELSLTDDHKAQNGEKAKRSSKCNTVEKLDQTDAADKLLSPDNTAPIVAGVKVEIFDEDLMFFGNTQSERRKSLKAKRKKSLIKPVRDRTDEGGGKSTSGVISWFKKNVCKCIAK